MVFATVGTDAHPFDRLIEWLDDLATARPELTVVVQHGASAAPRVAKGIDYVDHARLIELLRSADVVVTHGGPATIMEAREHHGRPIVVPRDPARGEHVDSHQLAFCGMLAEHQRATLARTRSELELSVQAHLSGEIHLGDAGSVLPAGIDRFIEEVDRLMLAPRRRWGSWRRRTADGVGE